MSTIRPVLGMVAVENLHLEQLDVKTAFLHGEFGGRPLHDSARRVHYSRTRKSSLQIEKKLVWPKISSKTMVQEI